MRLIDAENLKRHFDIKGAKFEAESIVKTIDRMPEYQRKDIRMDTRPHYYEGEIECWTAIRAAVQDKRGYEGFIVGNIIKYLWRYGKKGGYEDICKAGEYVEELKRYYKTLTFCPIKPIKEETKISYCGKADKGITKKVEMENE